MPTVTVGTGKTYASPQAAWDALSASDQGGTVTALCDGEDYPALDISVDSFNPWVFKSTTTYDFTAATEDLLARINRVIIGSAVTNNLTIEDVSVYSSNVFLIPWTCSANNARFNRLIIQQSTFNTQTVANNAEMLNTIYTKCVVLGGADSVRSGFGHGAKKVNCIFANSSDKGVEGSGGSGINIAEDCFSFNNTGIDYDTGQMTITTSASEDTTGTYTGYASAECVDFAGRNYLLKSTSALATISGGSFVGVGVEAGGGVNIASLLNSNYIVNYKMKKNVASQSVGAQMITAADGTAFTGTVSVLVTKDNGVQAAGTGTAPAHEGSGYHSYTPVQAETNADHLAFTFTGTGAVPVTVQTFTTFPQSADNNTILSTLPLATDIVSAGAITTLSGAVVNVDLVDTVTTNTDMRGTDSANTVVPPSVAQFNARSIPSADYFVVTDYTAPDNASVTSILADTNELQLNQGNWLTATGFSTSAEVTALNNVSVSDILTTQMTESYAADGVAPTLAQSLFLTMQNLQDFDYTGTTQTVKKLDGTTTAATYTLDDAVAPTSKTRAT